MKVLFATSGWATHFFMVAPLAWAFRVHGHEVRVASPPSGIEPIVQAGLPAVALGPDVDFIEIQQRALPHERPDHDKPESPEDLAELLNREGADEVLGAWQEAAFASTEDLVGFARAWRPALIVADTMTDGGFVAAHAIGVPAVRHLLSTDIMGSAEGDDLLAMLPGYRDHFEAYGATYTGDPAHRTVDPCPPSMQPPPGPARMQMRHVPYNGPASMPDWLLEPPSRPRVTITWGTFSAWSAGASRFLIPQVIDALAQLDVDVVLTVGTGQRELLGPLPESVRLLENFPLNLLLPTTDLMIHQGGSSTILTAASYGVPQLALPFLPEQVDDGGAHAATGAGISLFADDADVDGIRRSVTALLDEPSYGEAARRLRQEMLEQPSPVEIAARLAEMAGDAARL
jgi:UDP:flavonoid glycosyltransferase YjiC (YdhE family)